MKVIKRNGTLEQVKFDKITKRISALITPTEHKYKILDATRVTLQLLKSNYVIDRCKTSDIDEYAAEICAHMSTIEPHYNQLAGRICVSNLHKLTKKDEKITFSEIVSQCYFHKNQFNEKQPLVSKRFYDFVQEHKDKFNKWIQYKRDYDIDYFGFKTLQKSYLLKSDKKVIIESPQDMFMRVAIALHHKDVEQSLCSIDLIHKTYDLLSLKKYIHATPTLFNAGTSRQQLSSCFLVSIQDSLQDIYTGLSECAMISKNAGGIGIEIHDVRAKHSVIRSTNGTSDGIVPMLKVFESTARYVNQGGKRKGSIAVYLAPYHADIESFLDLRKNVGAETERARDLFTALWISDVFMKRVMQDKMWSLMCPDESKGLSNVYGKEFEALYIQYEKKGKFKKQIKARKLWEKIKISLIETGSPYIHFKDHVNRKNNQKNIGVIRTSNLCGEIMEVTNRYESAVCNLASISLSHFVKTKHTFPLDSNIVVFSVSGCNPCKNLKMLLDRHLIKYKEQSIRSKEYKELKKHYKVKTVPQVVCNGKLLGGYKEVKQMFTTYYDLDDLKDTVCCAIRNLNKVIDINFYPSDKTHRSNVRHRPIGLGVQGLADVYCKMKIPFESKRAHLLNRQIFETIYFGCMEESCLLAKERETYLKPIVSLFKKQNKTKKDKDKLDHLFKKYNIIPEELNRESHLGSYSTFIGSPLSNGQFQFNLWDKTWSSTESSDPNSFTSKWDWNQLRKKVKQYGVRNSLTTALMPTASTSQILGNNECFEPFTNNIYTRKTIAGLFRVINKYLIQDLQEEGLWDEQLKNLIIYHKGSIQKIDKIPQHIKDLHKTAYEIKQKVIIQQAADRGCFVDQSQSMNLFVDNKNNISKIIDSAIFTAWKLGLKTGLYYLRSKAAVDAIQFSVDKSKFINNNIEDDECLMCGS